MRAEDLVRAVATLAHGPGGEQPPQIGRWPEEVFRVALGMAEPARLLAGEVSLAFAATLGPALALGDAIFAHPDAAVAVLGRALCRDGTEAIGTRGRSRLRKLCVFVPASHFAAVRDAISAAGAGQIGNYRDCTFAARGVGTFRPLAGARPFIGQENLLSEVEELRLESVFPAYREAGVLAAMRGSHPYEEIAYDLYDLANPETAYGSARSGRAEVSALDELLAKVRSTLGAKELRCRRPATAGPLRRVACLGLAEDAAALAGAGADVVVGPVLAPWDAARTLEAGATLVEVVDLGECALALLGRRLEAALPIPVRLIPEGLTWRRCGSLDATGIS